MRVILALFVCLAVLSTPIMAKRTAVKTSFITADSPKFEEEDAVRAKNMKIVENYFSSVAGRGNVAKFLTSIFPMGNGPIVGGGAGGGTNCAACTVITGILEQIAQVDGPSKVLDRLCGMLKDAPLKALCDLAANEFGEIIIKGLEAKESPDHICHSLKFCTGTCQLFPSHGPPPPMMATSRRRQGKRDVGKTTKEGKTEEGIFPNPWKWFKDLINRFANNHNPLVDLDGDGFSTFKTMRGYDWDGRDCDDESANIHPGRLVRDPSVSPAVDHDCNGIAGIDASGVSYQSQYCDNTGMRAIALLGDSAGAHFTLPPAWFNVSAWTKDTFEGALWRLEDEFDLPMMSYATGFVPNVTSGDTPGPVWSVYLENLKRNQCNKNSRLNHGVNGERSGSMDDLVKSLSVNQTADVPFTIILELIGNDVCNGHEDTIAHMTTPEQFKENTITYLKYLDTVLPKGSAVILVGLARGTLLYEAMHDQTHPIGVKYPDFYDYLDCLQVSPCKGWMTSNATLRNATQQRADELTATLQSVAQEMAPSLENYEVDFFPFPMNDITTWYKGPLKDLICKVDGFHPSQLANFLIAKEFIKWIDNKHPTWLSPVNPNNQAILNHFG